MLRKYVGDKKSIEARSEDGGKTWKGKLFDAGRLTNFTHASLKEVDDLAAKHHMNHVPGARA